MNKLSLEGVKNNSGLNKFISKNHEQLNHNNSDGLIKSVRSLILGVLEKNPNFILQVDSCSRFLSSEQRKNAIENIIENGDINQWLPHCHSLRNILPDEILREKIIEIYRTQPWNIQTKKEKIYELFPNEFFKKILEKDPNDENIFQLFLTFNAHHDINSYDGILKEILREKTKNALTIEASLLWEKSPGFACGGMEKNYLSAMTTKTGICLVNGGLLAKFFHRKWEAKKVSYLPAKTYKTENGYILWENYFYAPSGWQHEKVISAIEAWEKTLYIPDLVLNTVRPANSLYANEKIFSNLEKDFWKIL